MIRLLHVEDDPDIREIVAMALGLSARFELVQCVDGPDALATLESFVPEILLLDMMMPGMSGVQLLQAIRLQPRLRPVPAIFMTARVQPDEVRGLLEHGAVEVIVKPFDPMTLGDRITAVHARGGGTGPIA